MAQKKLRYEGSMKGYCEQQMKLWDSGVGVDGEIKCGDKTWKVHKLYLEAASDYFRTSFRSKFAEGKNSLVQFPERVEGQSIEDAFSQDEVYLVLKFCYTHSFSVSHDFSKASAEYTSILQLSDYFGMPVLGDCVWTHITSRFSNAKNSVLNCGNSYKWHNGVDIDYFFNTISSLYALSARIPEQFEDWLVTACVNNLIYVRRSTAFSETIAREMPRVGAKIFLRIANAALGSLKCGRCGATGDSISIGKVRLCASCVTA